MSYIILACVNLIEWVLPLIHAVKELIGEDREKLLIKNSSMH